MMSSYASGWYFIAESSRVKKKAQQIRFFDRDLVLFRTQSGKATLLDAVCPHMGANLGGPGHKVDGEILRCPFHAWGFNQSGQCVDMPYCSKQIPKQARVHSYPLVEQDRSLFAYYHPRNELPDWSLPSWGKNPLMTGSFLRSKHSIGRQFDIAFNGFDLAHFPFVHKGSSIPTLQQGEIAKYFFKATMRTSYALTKNHSLPSILHFTHFGPGVIHVDFEAPIPGQMIASATPITGDQFINHVQFRFKRPRLFSSQIIIYPIMATAILSEAFKDGKIWQYKKELKRPLIMGYEGPYFVYKKWFDQFYVHEETQDESLSFHQLS